MARWNPGVRARLASAALELYASQGYEATTIAEIAAAVGVTPRTYFRQFPDKREVLFANAEVMRERITSAAERSVTDTDPWSATLEALAACEELFTITDRDELARRSAVIAAASELREREGRKLQVIADSLADALIGRGVDPANARVTADLGMVVFAEASRLWREDPSAAFAACVTTAARQVRGLVTAEVTP